MNSPNFPPLDEPALPPAGPPRRVPVAARAAAVFVAAGLVAVAAVFVVERHSGSGGTASAASGNGPPSGFAGGGRVDGEQRVQGTVTAKTAATSTVRTSGGTTATYAVNATSQLIRNGRQATVADIRVGDPVFLDAVPSSVSGRLLVERLFAGDFANQPPPRGFGAPTGAGRGGVDGEQRVQGTVTAKTATTITVRTSGGTTATYAVNATSELVRNGRRATLADIQVGDPVFLHALPSSVSGQLLVARLFAGGSSNRPGAPNAPGGPAPQGRTT